MSRAAAGRKRMLKQALPPFATYETTSTSQSASGAESSSFRVGKPWVKKEEKAKEKEGESVEEDRLQDLDQDATFDTNTSSTGLSINSSGSGSGSASNYEAVSGSSVHVSDRTSPQSFVFPTSRSKARPRAGSTPTSVGTRLRLGRSNSTRDKKGKGRAQDDEPDGSLNGSLRSPKLRDITATPSSSILSDFSGSGSALSSAHPLSPVSPSVMSSADGRRNTRSNSFASDASPPFISTGASMSAPASTHMHLSVSPVDDVSFTSPVSLYTTPPNSPRASLSSSLPSSQSSPPTRSAPAPFVFPTSRSRGHPSGPPLPVKIREARQAARARRASQSGASGTSTTTEDVDPVVVVTTESSSASPPRASAKAAWTSTTKWMGIPLNTVARRRNKNIGPGNKKAKGKERVIPSPVIREDEVVIGYDNVHVHPQASPSSTLSHPFFASAHSPTLPSGSYYQDPSRVSSHVSVSQWTQLSNETHTTLAPEDSYSQMGKDKDRDSLAAREKFWEKTRAAYRKDTDDGDAIRGRTLNRYSFSRRQSHHQDNENSNDSEEEEYDDDWDEDDSFLERYEQEWIDDEQARYLSRSYSFRSFGTDEEGQAALERGWARQRDRERILKMKMERKSDRKRRRGRRVEGYNEYGEKEGEWEQFDYNYEHEDEDRDDRERAGAREKVEGKRPWRMGTYPFNVRDEALLDGDQHTHTLLRKLIQHALSDSSSQSPSTPSSSTSLSLRSVNTHTTNTPVNSSPYTLTPTPSSPSTPLSGSSPLSSARTISTSSPSTFHPTPSVVLGPPPPSPSFHNYGPHPPASVLDLGCGLHGLWAREAANAWGGFGTRVVGMDLELELEDSDNDDVEDGKVAPTPNSEKVEQRITEKARLHLTTEIAKGQASNNEIDSPMRLVGGVIQGSRRDSPRRDEDDIRDTADNEDTKVESHSESPISSPKSLEFVKGNFVTSPLPFPSSSFDLVRIANLTYVIPYEKWESLLEEVCRVLTVGGRLEVVDDHVFFAYGKLETSMDNDGNGEESREKRRESTFSGTAIDERSSYYFRHSLAPSQYSTFTLTSPEVSTPTSPSSPHQNPSMADVSDSATSTLPAQEHSQRHQQYLEALYHYRYRQQSWKNRQTTARSLESLFEHLMNIKYGIHLCPSEFLEGLMERVMGFAKEVGSWHLLLVAPEIESDRAEVQNVRAGVDVVKRQGKSRKKDKVTSPAAAIASDFRSRSMAALITDLGLPEQEEDKDGGSDPDTFSSGEDEDDSDSDSDDSNDVLKNSPGLILWPNKLLPLSQNELQANVLNHCRTLLACSEQLRRYAGELEVMKYRFERDEYRDRDKSGDGQEEDSDPDTEEERELEHEMRLRVEAEVEEALEEYRSFLHDRFNPPRPPALLSASKPLSHNLPSDDDRRSIETLHENVQLSTSEYPQHVSSSIVSESPVAAVHVTTSTRDDFSHHSRNSSTTTVSSDDRSAIWEYQSELQDHISWTSEETKEDPPVSPTSPDTPRAHLQELEEEYHVQGPSPGIGTPNGQSRFDLYNVASSDSGSRAVSADRQVPEGASDKKNDEPILVRTIHVYEGIKLDGSVLSIGSAI